MTITQRLNQAIPITVEESGWAYNGPFSTYKEIHSFILGFAAGYTNNPMLKATAIAYATGRGTTKSKDSGERADAHWRQVAEEPAYALGGMTLGQQARSLPIDTIVDAVVTLV